MFLIRDIKYQSINVSSNTIGNSNLEIQGIRINWRGKYLNIFNRYQPPDLNKIPTDLQNLFLPSTICLGDLNAKHFMWGSSGINSRGVDLLNKVDDNGFVFLNDGSPTNYSHSYNSKEALVVNIVSPDLSPACNWKVLENIGSYHLPILFELNKRQTTYKISNRRWNFKRADWKAYTDRAEKLICAELLTDNLKTDWLPFKRTIYSAAGQSIPRGKFRRKRPYLTSKMSVLQPLIAERRLILKDLDSDHSDTNRIKLNRVNAQLKKMYAQIKRGRWNELCSSPDSRSSNSKLWKLVKGISEEQLQFEKCNAIQLTEGLLAQNDEQAANILGEHYQLISCLNFTGNDKYAKTMESNVVHGCHSNPHVGPAIFSRAFSAQELDAAILGWN
ncbi:RNA-directed DNA polymerase from mobile element jockey [Trichonephila clavipes]|nr:RNA-directed DNA polymerase from mobile element jockey [Trichonephila clavipes]